MFICAKMPVIIPSGPLYLRLASFIILMRNHDSCWQLGTNCGLPFVCCKCPVCLDSVSCLICLMSIWPTCGEEEGAFRRMPATQRKENDLSCLLLTLMSSLFVVMDYVITVNISQRGGTPSLPTRHSEKKRERPRQEEHGMLQVVGVLLSPTGLSATARSVFHLNECRLYVCQLAHCLAVNVIVMPIIIIIIIILWLLF